MKKRKHRDIVKGAGIGLMILLLFTVGIANGDNIKTEPDTDRKGGDYAKIFVPGTNPDFCAQECLADSRCLAATFARPGTSEGSGSWCWLKDRVPESSPNPDCITFVRIKEKKNYPLVDAQRITITDDPSGDMMDLKIDGNYVIWVWESPGKDSSSDQIFVYDIVAGTTTNLTDDPFRHEIKDVDECRILWTDPQGIVLYNISDRERKTIVPDPAANIACPRISGDYMTWRDSRNITNSFMGVPYSDPMHVEYSGGQEIHGYNLTTNTETLLTEDNYKTGDNHNAWDDFKIWDFLNKGCPVISGNRIAWTEFKDGKVSIILLDTLTGTRNRISTDLSYPGDLQMEKNRIFWGSGNGISYYDTGTGIRGNIPGGSFSHPSYTVSGDLAVRGGYYRSGNGIEIYHITAGKTFMINGSDEVYFPSADGRSIAGLLREPVTLTSGGNIVLYSLPDQLFTMSRNDTVPEPQDSLPVTGQGLTRNDTAFLPEGSVPATAPGFTALAACAVISLILSRRRDEG